MKWLRLYTELLDDPKVQTLPLRAFKGWINVLCLAARNGGAIRPADVAFALRIEADKAQALINELIDAKLLVHKGEHIEPHNWSTRQYKSDHDATERWRRHQANVGANVGQTPNPTPPDTDTETEQKRRDARERARLEEKLFAGWWEGYPHKVGKADALKAYRTALGKASPEELAEGVQRYRRSKPSDRPWLNPATFLRQERWLDAPGLVTQAGRPDPFRYVPRDDAPKEVFVLAGSEEWLAWERSGAKMLRYRNPKDTSKVGCLMPTRFPAANQNAPAGGPGAPQAGDLFSEAG